MRVTYNENDYTVWWHYIRDHNPAERSYHSEFTECHIERKGAEDFEIVVDTARKAPEETNFSKETGRRVSLARALKQLFPADREARAIFWARYFER